MPSIPPPSGDYRDDEVLPPKSVEDQLITSKPRGLIGFIASARAVTAVNNARMKAFQLQTRTLMDQAEILSRSQTEKIRSASEADLAKFRETIQLDCFEFLRNCKISELSSKTEMRTRLYCIAEAAITRAEKETDLTDQRRSRLIADIENDLEEALKFFDDMKRVFSHSL